MSRLKSTILGCYIPSFFEMHINTNCNDLTITHLSPKDRIVLFHEYIHFMQDFCTYYGLNSIYTYSEYLHSVVNRIYKLDSTEFDIPFVISDNSDNVLLNIYISKLTLGDTGEYNKFVVENVSIISDQLPENNHMSSIPSIILNKNKNICSFGAMAIMENMAYIMERLCAPNDYVLSPDFPYRSAELVADYYVPQFSGDLLKLLALCDMCLQSSNPGVCFVRTMQEIKEGVISVTTPESIYDYFYEKKTAMADGAENKYLSGFKKLLTVVQECLKSYIRIPEKNKSYYQWIDKLVQFAIDWRENDRYFLLKMARCNDLLTNGCWGKIIHDVGTPLMCNNLGNYFKIPPHGTNIDMDVEYLRSIREINLLFEKGQIECSMLQWCQNSPESTPNEKCKKEPWEKSKEQNLCPYAMLWKHWNLSNKKPRYR